jgi:transcriptional pleiotropic repressor
MSELLNKTRKLNKILQRTGDSPVSFNELSELLRDVLDSNVYVISKKGKVLGTSFIDVKRSSVVVDYDTNEAFFPQNYVKTINELTDTLYNITEDKLLEYFEGDTESYYKIASIVPILGSGKRLGTLILAREENIFHDDDIVLAEYAATVVAMEIIRSDRIKIEDEARKKAVVQMAIGTLSYSELEAVIHIFNHLGANEGLLVASKIADTFGITRSVIVNALRKLESAGVIESRSLGMKGTHLRILNEKLMEELDKVKK